MAPFRAIKGVIMAHFCRRSCRWFEPRDRLHIEVIARRNARTRAASFADNEQPLGDELCKNALHRARRQLRFLCQPRDGGPDPSTIVISEIGQPYGNILRLADRSCFLNSRDMMAMLMTAPVDPRCV